MSQDDIDNFQIAAELYLTDDPAQREVGSAVLVPLLIRLIKSDNARCLIYNHHYFSVLPKGNGNWLLNVFHDSQVVGFTRVGERLEQNPSLGKSL